MARVILVSPWSSIWKVNRVPGMWHKCDASFSEGFAQVRKDFKYGYIDKSGKLVIEIEPQYNEVGYFSEGLARVAIES